MLLLPLLQKMSWEQSVLRDGRESEETKSTLKEERTLALEDAQNLAAGDGANLRNSVAVTEQHADLRRRKTLLGRLADELVNLWKHTTLVKPCDSHTALAR